MMMWISCLLIGSIICNLLQPDYGSYAAAPPLVADSGYLTRGYFNPSQSHVPLRGTLNAEPASDDSQNVAQEYELHSPSFGEVPYWGRDYEAGGYDGVFPDKTVFVPPHSDEQWRSATGYGDRDELYKPVFSHLSPLEPVYTFDSGSRYKRGRVVFAQTRYIPGEPRYPFWPVYRRFGRTNWRRPAKTASPGGY